MGFSWGFGEAAEKQGYQRREYSPPSAQAPSDSGSIPGCSQTNLQNKRRNHQVTVVSPETLTGILPRSPCSLQAGDLWPFPPTLSADTKLHEVPMLRVPGRLCLRSSGRGGAAKPGAGRRQSPGTTGWGPSLPPSGAQKAPRHPSPRGTREAPETRRLSGDTCCEGPHN